MAIGPGFRLKLARWFRGVRRGSCILLSRVDYHSTGQQRPTWSRRSRPSSSQQTSFFLCHFLCERRVAVTDEGLVISIFAVESQRSVFSNLERVCDSHRLLPEATRDSRNLLQANGNSLRKVFSDRSCCPRTGPLRHPSVVPFPSSSSSRQFIAPISKEHFTEEILSCGLQKLYHAAAAAPLAPPFLLPPCGRGQAHLEQF